MAYLKFNNTTVHQCAPTVEIIINWLRREYKAEIKLITSSRFYLFEVMSDELPASKYLEMSIEELIPQVLIVNVGYAE